MLPLSNYSPHFLPPPSCLSIQAPNLLTLVYTPGDLSSAQPWPQLTTPTRVFLPLSADTRGPPESLLQASFPPCGTLAHSMVSTTLVLYTLFLDMQAELEMMFTSTVRSLVLGSSLAALVVPKPVTVATEPTGGL